MVKNCKFCACELNLENRADNRLACKKCRSKEVTKANIGNPKRQKYMREYIRKIGLVKQYPCETCDALCYKKYSRAFCSDKCRFLTYAKKEENGCWLWLGAKNRNNYGQLCFEENKKMSAHRVSYKLFKGPIENNLYVCHLCDIPSCVNPDHLWLGNNMENMLDMVEKGRQHSKLNPKDVLEIRKLWQKGWSNSKLMEKFKLTAGAISNIISRRIWKHI